MDLSGTAARTCQRHQRIIPPNLTKARISSFALIAVSLIFVCGKRAVAQTVGIQPYGSYQTSKVDQIDLANLGLHIDIPLFVHKGRGVNIGAQVHLIYDLGNLDAGEWTLSAWTGSGGQLTALKQTFLCTPSNPHSPTYDLYTFKFVDPTGYEHQFPGTTLTSYCGAGANPPSGSTSLNETLSDGSGYTLSAKGPGGTVFAPDGTQVGSGVVSGFLDPNGNTGQTVLLNSGPGKGFYGTITDDSGVSVSISGGVVSGTQISPTAVTYTDTNGKPQTITINYVQGANAIFATVKSIVYPDQSAYNFTYSPSDAGELTSMQLPQSGTISYQLMSPSSSCTSNCVTTLTRTTTDGTVTYQNTSSAPGVSMSAYTTISKPGTGGSEEIYFVGTPVTTTNISSLQLETAHFWLNTSGTAIRSTMKCYNGASGNCTTATVNLPLTQISTTTTLDNGQASKTVELMNSLGLQTELDEYDYGATSPTLKTITTYASLGNNISSRPQSLTVEDGAGNTVSNVTYGYDEYSVTPSGVSGLQSVSGSRGNMTSQHYADGTSSHWKYDDAGQVVMSQDSAGNAGNLWTSYGHDSTDTYITSTQLPTPSSGVAMSTSATFNAATGLQLTSVDVNGNTTTYKTYDSMLRPTEIDFPDGGKATYGYTLTQLSFHLYQNTTTFEDLETLYDGYGRVSRTAIANGQGTNPWYQQDICYNSMGQVGFQSYFYQGTGFGAGKVCSGAGDTYTYDTLNRISSITHGDNAQIDYRYTGRATETKDENGVSTIVQTDALGRQTIACEISSNGSMPDSGSPTSCGTDFAGTGFVTSYAYGLANHTTTVTQGAQTRVFQNDAMGRPILVQEPESGQTTYSYAYNGTGLVVTRQRPKANQMSASTLTTTTTQYDLLGRVVSITYNDGITSNKEFDYDAVNSAMQWSETTTNIKGALADMASGSGATLTRDLFSYDPMGRVTTLWQCGPSICGTSQQASRPAETYGYDWAGNLTYESDSVSGPIAYTRSPAGEVTSITNEYYAPSGAYGSPASLVANIQNSPFGPLNWTLANGLTGVRIYDTLGRVDGGYLCNGSTQANCTGGNPVYGYSVEWKGQQATGTCDTVQNTCDAVKYDEFNRLQSLTATQGQMVNFSYVYDRWGNRWQQNASGDNAPSPQLLNFNPSNNQITSGGYLYDAAGNLLSDGVHSFQYDAEGNVVSAFGGNDVYVYDALNRRERTQTATGTYEYAFDYAGRRIATWTISGQPEAGARIYWDGLEVAFRAYNGATYFDTKNWLGTERMRTSYTGAVAASYTSLVFGDDYTPTVNDIYGDQDNNHFAMLDHDPETDTDNAQFRQYGNIQGRWMSPDPYTGSYDLTNPQSLNRYSYALNNPLAFNDPSGHDCVYSDSNFGNAVATANRNEGSAAMASVIEGDCLSENDDGYYVDCDGCLLGNGIEGHLDQATGDLYFTNNGNQILDDNGNPTLIQGFTDPQGTSTTVTVNGGSSNLLSGKFSFDTSQNQFIQMMQQSGFRISQLDTMLGKTGLGHPGVNMRDALPTCSMHVSIDPNSGNNGGPVTGEFHYDLFNPLKSLPTGPATPNVPLLPFHVVSDVIPDLAMKLAHTSWTGNQECR